jgi:hypothetical protein
MPSACNHCSSRTTHACLSGRCRTCCRYLGFCPGPGPPAPQQAPLPPPQAPSPPPFPPAVPVAASQADIAALVGLVQQLVQRLSPPPLPPQMVPASVAAPAGPALGVFAPAAPLPPFPALSPVALHLPASVPPQSAIGAASVPAPPSHRAAFPPPLAGLNPAVLLSSAQAAQVSAQQAHIPPSAADQGGGLRLFNSPVGGDAVVNNHQHIHLPSPAAARFLDLNLPSQPVQASEFASLPPWSQQVKPTMADSAPSTPEGLDAFLTDWVRGIRHPQFRSNLDRQYAFDDYCRATVRYSRQFGTAPVWRYHLDCVSAAQQHPPRFDPERDGHTYPVAYFNHLSRLPDLSLGQRSSFRKGGTDRSTDKPKKRKAPELSGNSDPSADCRVTGHKGHSNADCRQQKAQAERRKKMRQEDGAASA